MDQISHKKIFNNNNNQTCLHKIYHDINLQIKLFNNNNKKKMNLTQTYLILLPSTNKRIKKKEDYMISHTGAQFFSQLQECQRKFFNPQLYTDHQSDLEKSLSYCS